MTLTTTDNNQVAKKDGFSWQRWQEMYRAITHKSDTLVKHFDFPNTYSIEDIEELHGIMSQLADTYPVIEQTHNVTAVYLDKSKTTYANFNGFRTKVTSNTSPLKSITLVHNLLIKHPQTENPHNYRCSIDMASSAAIFKEMDQQQGSMRFFIKNFGLNTGRAEIEFVDYSIAQNFMNSISNWFSSRKKSKLSSALIFIQKHSSIIPFISKTLFTLLYAYAAYKFFDYGNFQSSLRNLSIFFIFASCFGVICRELAFKAGAIIENNIDEISAFSCINITRGDAELIKEFTDKNRSSVKKAILNTALQLGIGVISSLVAHSISP